MLGADRASVGRQGYSIYFDDPVTVLLNLSEMVQYINIACFLRSTVLQQKFCHMKGCVLWNIMTGKRTLQVPL